MRGTEASATLRQVRVSGFQISGVRMVPLSLNSVPEVLPPMIMTSPVGKMTALLNLRTLAIDATRVLTGLAPFRSMIMAWLLPGAVLALLAAPPATRILPSSYMIELLYLGYQVLLIPALLMLPLPVGLIQFIWVVGPLWKTCPFGAR